MGSVVKSIGKAIGKIAKGIGKLVKKALPIILLAVGVYAGVSAFGAMGNPAMAGQWFSPQAFQAGWGKIGNFLSGGSATAAQAASTAVSPNAVTQSLAAGSPASAFSPTTAGSMGSVNLTKAYGLPQGLSVDVSGKGLAIGSSMSGDTMLHAVNNNGVEFLKQNVKNVGAGMTQNEALAAAMKYQADMTWKGTLLSAAGKFVGTLADDSNEVLKEIHEMKHTYGGHKPGEGDPKKIPKSDPYWQRMGQVAEAQRGTRRGGLGPINTVSSPQVPAVNRPGLLRSRTQSQPNGLLGQKQRMV